MVDDLYRSAFAIRADKSSGDDRAAAQTRGLYLLEVDWAAGISIQSPQLATVSYPLALRAYTTAARVTGKALR